MMLSACTSAKHQKSRELQTDLAMRQMHSDLEDHKYKLDRLEVELQIVDGKADSFSGMNQELRREIAKMNRSEEQSKSTSISEMSAQLQKLGQQAQSCLKEIGLLHHEINVLRSHIEQQQTQLHESEKLLVLQERTLDDLQASLNQIHASKPSDYYIVQKGDTIESIAKLMQINIQDLMTLNELESKDLTIGQKLRLK